MKPNLDGNENGIIEIQPKSKNEEWIFIGNKKVWTRNCPKCNSTIYYNNKYRKTYSEKNKKLCRSCSCSGSNNSNFGKGRTEETKEKIRNSHKKLNRNFNGENNPFYKKLHKKESKQKMRDFHLGKRLSEQTRKKIGKSSKERIRSEQTKQKTRESILKRISLLGTAGNYNPIACAYFDQLNKINEWNLKHALNGGEVQVIGYSLDAYDKERNIVVEYDEPLHEKPSIKNKDIIRQQRIITHLKCTFYRYSEKYKTLTRIEK